SPAPADVQHDRHPAATVREAGQGVARDSRREAAQGQAPRIYHHTLREEGPALRGVRPLPIGGLRAVPLLRGHAQARRQGVVQAALRGSKVCLGRVRPQSEDGDHAAVQRAAAAQRRRRHPREELGIAEGKGP
ncbi:unnamed protein product, partial [Ectocarpus sp. 12 AP-2014]